MTVCIQCGKEFYRPPAFHRYAAKRGSEVKLCSRACTDAARSSGLIGTKKRRGIERTCEICGTLMYMRQSRVDRRRFCSEPCRKEAFRRKMIARTEARPEARTGKEVQCMFCGETVYRRGSHLLRNISKTCGKPECISAYGRSLWGLEPHDEDKVKRPRHQRRYRKENFSQMQRREWIDTECAWCKATDNLMLDHIIPVAAGGKAEQKNAQTLCGACNNWKAVYVDRPLARNRSPKGG